MLSSGFVFISGPYRGADYLEVEANIAEATNWAAALAVEGIPYFCPHMNSAHMEVIVPEVPGGFWLDLDRRILRYATALLLVRGWRDSAGARAELEYAHELKMPIYTDLMFNDLVKDWRAANV